MFFASVLDSLLPVSPLLFLGALAMAFIYLSVNGKDGAGCLVLGGLGLGGFAGLLMLGGGGNVWGPAALLVLFVVPLFAFFGISGGIFVSALLGRRRGWVIVAGIPLAGLGLLLVTSEWEYRRDTQNVLFWRRVLATNDDTLPKEEYLKHARKDMGFVRGWIKPTASPKLLKIVLEVWPQGCWEIASMPHIDREIIEGILAGRWAEKSEASVRSLASNPRVPEEILFSLVDGVGVEEPSGVANNPAASPRCLRAAFRSAAEVLSHPDAKKQPRRRGYDHRFDTARNTLSSAGTKLLEKDVLTNDEWDLLVAQGTPYARKTLASRADAPLRALEVLARDEKPEVHAEALARLTDHPELSSEERSAWKERAERAAIAQVLCSSHSEHTMRNYLLDGSQTEKETALRIMVWGGGSYLALLRNELSSDPVHLGQFVAGTEGLSPQVYQWLSASRHMSVRVAAQEKLRTSRDTNEKELRTLLEKLPVPDRLMAVSALAHSSRMLEFLASDPDRQVSELARKKLAGDPQ